VARRADDTIPDDEALFRGLRPEWVDEVGEILLEAVDYKGTSVNRAAHSSRASVLSSRYTRVAEITQSEFPPPTELNGVTWEFIAVDAPLDVTEQFAANDAHAEIRFHRPSDESREATWPKSSAARDELRAALAARLRLLS